MAFPSTGVSVTCGFVGSTGRSVSQPAFRMGAWSESISSGATTNAAPELGQTGSPLFHVRAFADSWIAIGPNPNAAVSPRFPVAAGQEYDFVVSKGDKLSCVAA